MQEIKPLIKLDISLKLFKNDRGHISFDDMLSRLKNYGLDIEGDELLRIIDKLLKDKYIYAKLINDREVYAISFDGWIFQQKGGYEQDSFMNEANKRLGEIELTRVRWVDSQLVRNASRLNKLTGWLAFGSIALALFEALKFLQWAIPAFQSICHCEFLWQK